jgi:hypothetical protein
MELRQIRSFLCIAETLHFGRTAELVHLSQCAAFAATAGVGVAAKSNMSTVTAKMPFLVAISEISFLIH